MRQNIERIHDAEMQAAQLRDQIADLQKKLSDSHLSIYDEKSYAMQLLREYQLLQQQGRSDKKKLDELNQLSEEINAQAEPE